MKTIFQRRRQRDENSVIDLSHPLWKNCTLAALISKPTTSTWRNIRFSKGKSQDGVLNNFGVSSSIIYQWPYLKSINRFGLSFAFLQNQYVQFPYIMGGGGVTGSMSWWMQPQYKGDGSWGTALGNAGYEFHGVRAKFCNAVIGFETFADSIHEAYFFMNTADSNASYNLHHYAMTWDHSSIPTVYVDGAKAPLNDTWSSYGVDVNFNDYPFIIGNCSNTDSSQAFNGVVSDAIVWEDRQLTQSDVQLLATTDPMYDGAISSLMGRMMVGYVSGTFSGATHYTDVCSGTITAHGTCTDASTSGVQTVSTVNFHTVGTCVDKLKRPEHCNTATLSFTWSVTDKQHYQDGVAGTTTCVGTNRNGKVYIDYPIGVVTATPTTDTDTVYHVPTGNNVDNVSTTITITTTASDSLYTPVHYIDRISETFKLTCFVSDIYEYNAPIDFTSLTGTHDVSGFIYGGTGSLQILYGAKVSDFPFLIYTHLKNVSSYTRQKVIHLGRVSKKLSTIVAAMQLLNVTPNFVPSDFSYQSHDGYLKIIGVALSGQAIIPCQSISGDDLFAIPINPSDEEQAIFSTFDQVCKVI